MQPGYLVQKLVATEIVARDFALPPQLLLDDRLGGNAGVVTARVPQRALAHHPVPARNEEMRGSPKKQ
jgi:hypothetical protein